MKDCCKMKMMIFCDDPAEWTTNCLIKISYLRVVTPVWLEIVWKHLRSGLSPLFRMTQSSLHRSGLNHPNLINFPVNQVWVNDTNERLIWWRGIINNLQIENFGLTSSSEKYVWSGRNGCQQIFSINPFIIWCWEQDGAMICYCPTSWWYTILNYCQF